MAQPNVKNWQGQILEALGAPATPQNLTFLNDWSRAEGGGAANNPFNTTQPAPGASSYNSVGVRNFVSPQQGIQATVQTLNNGRYGNILSALRAGNDAHASAQALANSPWGTGSLVLKMLGDTGSSSTSPAKIGGAPGVPSPPAAPSALPKQDNTLNLLAAGAALFGLDPAPLQALAQKVTTVTPPEKVAAGITPAAKQAKAPSLKTGSTIRFLEHFAEPYGLTVTSTTGGKHASGSYHYRGRAVDFGGDPARMAALAATALEHPKQFVEFIYTGPGNPGYSILKGQVIPNSQLPKSLFDEHTNHVHLAS